MSLYALLRQQLVTRPRRWLITGAAGFIGSHLLEALLALDQQVVGLDDFSTGARRNLDEVRTLLRFKDEPTANCGDVNELLDEHIGHVSRRIKELRALEKQLKDLKETEIKLW